MLRAAFAPAFGGVMLLAVLTACSGGGSSSSSMPPPGGVVEPQAGRKTVDAQALEPPQSLADPAARALLIVSDAAANTVDAFTTTGKLTATITGLSEPQGLSSDPAGDIFIANTGAGNILVYKNDFKTLESTLNDPNGFPVGVDVSTVGLVGVTNLISTSGGPGSVSFYAKGATTPCASVAASNWSRIYFGAFDRAGTLYIDGQNSAGDVLLGYVSGGCLATSITTLKSTVAFAFPGTVAVSPADKLVVGDRTLYTFDLPVKNTLGPPIAKTILRGAGTAAAFALTASGNDLWTISSQALEYAYPAGGSPVKRVPLTGLLEPVGLIVTPFAQP